MSAFIKLWYVLVVATGKSPTAPVPRGAMRAVMNRLMDANQPNRLDLWESKANVARRRYGTIVYVPDVPTGRGRDEDTMALTTEAIEVAQQLPPVNELLRRGTVFRFAVDGLGDVAIEVVVKIIRTHQRYESVWSGLDLSRPELKGHL